FAVIREVAKQGSSVVIVSHRLDEVMRISDRVSILLDGRRVDTVSTSRTTERRLVAAMLGHELDILYPQRTVAPGRKQILSVENLTGRIASGVSFEAHQGEILGLTGLLGMGHDEIPYLVFGARGAESGKVALDGHRLDDLTPGSAIEAGMAFLPAHRQRQSGIPKATLLENVSMTSAPRSRLNGMRREAERSSVLRLLRRFDVRPPEPERLLATLSGGNQQKALLAKWLQTRPRLLLLHEPTQGVDIGSRKQILQTIAEVAAAGTAVVIASAEYEELANLCHRVLVFRHGRVVQELSGDHLTEARIAEQCF